MEFYTFKNVLTPGEISQVIDYAQVSFHHDDDGGHGSEGGHLETIKPNYLPHVAAKISEHFGPDTTPERMYAVDSWVKLYRLKPETPPVHQHRDKDFMAPKGLRAEWSVLVFLNDTYEGGETVFEADDGIRYVCPHPEPGDVLVFPHNLLHEGLPVGAGVKIVLKTDILFSL